MILHTPSLCFFFFFNDTPTPEIYTLSLHDALPICFWPRARAARYAGRYTNTRRPGSARRTRCPSRGSWGDSSRSEEHTSELQSHSDLVCRLLLEKKKKKNKYNMKIRALGAYCTMHT